MTSMRIAYAGDRDISVWVLDYLLEQGIQPLALLVSESEKASHAADLIARCDHLPPDHILTGKAFRKPAGRAVLQSLELDVVIGVHFPYIVPPGILALPKLGVLNLHPAYLPYNRGWHTPSWALLDDTPIGATLHIMAEGVDTGDIIHQKELIPGPDDTANSLYVRLKQLEFDVFKAAWPVVAAGTFERRAQQPGEGTTHHRKELFTGAVQQIDLDAPTTARALLRQLRALTTNDVSEAAYFDADGKRYRVQVHIEEEHPPTEEH